jgi:hypothetical protein
MYQLIDNQPTRDADTVFANICRIIAVTPFTFVGGGGGLAFYLAGDPTLCSNNVLISWAVTG